MLRPDGTLVTWKHGAREIQMWTLPSRTGEVLP